MAFNDRYGISYESPGPIVRWPLIILLLVAAGAGWWVWHREKRALEPPAEPRPVTARGDLAPEEKMSIEIFQAASPSVVHITTVSLQRDIFTLDVFRVPEGTGSGFVWDGNGHIVTNYHVVQNIVENQAGGVQVVLDDRTTWDAQWARTYPDRDLAVLKIDAPKSKLHPILVGSSHDLKVGQAAFAIGNPFGLDHTLTKGIVSALDREIKSVTGSTIKGMIQTDAAVNPGNSGGPLLDSAGRLIGVNTAIISASKSSAGIGFALPVDEVNRVVPQLISHGKVVHPGIGVQVADDEWNQRLGIEGAIILSVTPGSPAAQAGLRPIQRRRGRFTLGDVIVAVGGKPVQSKSAFYDALENYKVGDTVKLTVKRGEEDVDVQVTLEAGA